MMPLFPAYPLNELAEESRRAARGQARRTAPFEPTDEVDYDALTPDPLFMGLRRLVHMGPIGALVRWVDRWIDARDERRYGTGVDTTSTINLPVHHVEPTNHKAPADHDERIAA